MVIDIHASQSPSCGVGFELKGQKWSHTHPRSTHRAEADPVNVTITVGVMVDVVMWSQTHCSTVEGLMIQVLRCLPLVLCCPFCEMAPHRYRAKLLAIAFTYVALDYCCAAHNAHKVSDHMWCMDICISIVNTLGVNSNHRRYQIHDCKSHNGIPFLCVYLICIPFLDSFS